MSGLLSFINWAYWTKLVCYLPVLFSVHFLLHSFFSVFSLSFACFAFLSFSTFTLPFFYLSLVFVSVFSFFPSLTLCRFAFPPPTFPLKVSLQIFLYSLFQSSQCKLAQDWISRQLTASCEEKDVFYLWKLRTQMERLYILAFSLERWWGRWGRRKDGLRWAISYQWELYWKMETFTSHLASLLVMITPFKCRILMQCCTFLCFQEWRDSTWSQLNVSK